MPKAATTRHIPNMPEKVLDAPELLDDYCKFNQHCDFRFYFPDGHSCFHIHVHLTILICILAHIFLYFKDLWENELGKRQKGKKRWKKFTNYFYDSIFFHKILDLEIMPICEEFS